MNSTFVIAAGLAAMLCCNGCPAGDGGSDNAKPVATKLTGDSGTAAANTAEAKPVADEVVINEGMFDVSGVKLGMTYDAWLEYYPDASGVTLESTWTTEGETGLVSAIPGDLDLAPIDSAWFYNTQLVGFNSDFNMTQEDFTSRIATVEAKYGEAAGEPPAWALETPFFRGYEDPTEGFIQRFWFNEDGHEVMMSFHIDDENFGAFSLINVELLDGRIEEALIAKMNKEREGDVEGGPDAAAAGANAGQAAEVRTEFEVVPAGKFGFDGVYLGAEADLVKSRYEARKLTVMGMWVDRDWTGRVDGNPMNGDLYPSEAAWFLDGGLVMFMSTFAGSDSSYAKAVNSVAGVYGEQLSDIPDWAKDTDFFESLNFQGKEEGVSVWVDEASRGVFFITFEQADGLIMAIMVDLDNYLEAMETTNEAVEAQGHS